MRYSVYDLRTAAYQNLSSSNPSASIDFYGSIVTALRNMKLEIAPPELVRKAYIEDAIYNKTNNYGVPADLNYDDIIEIKRLDSRNSIDTIQNPTQLVYRKSYNTRGKLGQIRNVVTIGYENGLKTMSLLNPTGIPENREQSIHRMDSLNENGIWTVSGNIGNLRIDNLKKVQGKASFAFDVNDSGNTGTLQTVNMKAVDISSYIEKGGIQIDMSLGSPKSFETIEFKFKSSPTDYFRYTVNSAHNNTSFVEGWNKIIIPIKDMYPVGVPNIQELTGISVEVTTNGNRSVGNNIDAIWVKDGEVYEMLYQSSYGVIDANSGAFKHRPESGSDKFVFEDDTFQILVLETTLALQSELYANSATSRSDATNTENKLTLAYNQYKKLHKSEVIQHTDYNYDFSTDYDGGYYSDNY